MAENLRIGADVMNWYVAVIHLKTCLNNTLSESPSGVYADNEFCSHLRIMADVHASLFNERCKKISGRRRTYLKTREASSILDEFIQDRYNAYKREKEYRESRPDLFD